MEMIPYTGKRPSKRKRLESGMYQGIVITVLSEHLSQILDKIDVWFEERDEIIFVESGSTNKKSNGFIILEWEGYEIDPLFLKILEHDDMVEDYAVYIREEV